MELQGTAAGERGQHQGYWRGAAQGRHECIGALSIHGGQHREGTSALVRSVYTVGNNTAVRE